MDVCNWSFGKPRLTHNFLDRRCHVLREMAVRHDVARIQHKYAHLSRNRSNIAPAISRCIQHTGLIPGPFWANDFVRIG